jgi:hypothetical protein
MTTISQYFSQNADKFGKAAIADTFVGKRDGLYWIGERRHSMDDRECEVRGFPANARLVWRDDLAASNLAANGEGWSEEVIDILGIDGALLGRLRSGSEAGNSCNYCTEFTA